jgi:hypothetical protein
MQGGVASAKLMARCCHPLRASNWEWHCQRYFFKAMVGGAAWKKRFEEDVRFGTNILEAYTQATLENNYFVWVYEYVKENPGSTLKTEYDVAGDANTTDDDC